MQERLTIVFAEYNDLIPPREEGMIILLLDDKIKRKEIDDHFSYTDFAEIVKEVSELSHGSQLQTQRVLRKLMRYFIERPPDKPNRYVLSNFAYRFIQLIEKKLDHPFKNFPLIDSFKQYTSFRAEDILTIESFRSWYMQGFNVTTQETISEHLEALKDETEKAIAKLNKILYSDALPGIELVKQFTEIFSEFGSKADQISETLELGNALEVEVKKVVDSFYFRIENIKAPQTAIEREHYATLVSDFYESEGIQKKVLYFFEIVDMRLGQIREKIVFASSKLKELQDNFKIQSRFKINFKRMLQFVLENGSYSKDGPTLPNGFPLKMLPYDGFTFYSVPKYDFLPPNKNSSYQSDLDSEYENIEREKIEKELNEQEIANSKVELCKDLIYKTGKLDVSELFYVILNEDNNINIPIQVEFELLQFAASKSELKFKIEKEFPSQHIDDGIFIYKTEISNGRQ